MPDGIGSLGYATTITVERALSLPDRLSPEQIQTLGGRPPLDQTRRQWMWTGPQDVTLLLSDTAKAREEERLLFYAGLILGIAGAAAMTVLIEFAGAVGRAHA